MAKPQPVDPVKLFVAVLWAAPAALESALACLRASFGPIDFTGADHPFDQTDYYQDEMGPDLKRRLLCFTALAPPEGLVLAKLRCNQIEDELTRAGQRTVNLDIGYLDHHKVVLASLKGLGHKIHLGQGVYADLVGRYRDGRYQPFEWTFLDFRDSRYDSDLARIRSRYMEQLRAQHRTP